MAWSTLAFMAFSAVWGFGNVVNGFSEFGGLQAIVSWILIFAIYFVPYALMVGELGSSFKNLGGGVSSWISETINPKIAYYAGWTYWIVHMPYISQKPQGAIIAGSWAIFQSNVVSGINPLILQSACLVLFLVGLMIASKGMNPLKKITALAGTSMFVMSILFIVLMMAAPAITNASFMDIDWSAKTFLPTFDVKYFTSLSILVFAVGGCEKISPYVNKVENPGKGFQRGMIALAIMVAICAILGTVSLGMMFKQNEHGVFINGNKLIAVIVSILIIVPASGIENVDAMVKWLVKLNSVCMPLHYLWVFVAYIALKKAGEKFVGEYQFTKSKTLGILIGIWCFAFTAFACIGGMYSEDKFQLILNIVTPLVLTGLGFIMPMLAEKERVKKGIKEKAV